jgi:putative transcriptional regulator
MIVCKLKKVLKRKGWTRYKLQKKSGITYPTLQALFYGRNQGYSVDVLNKLCSTLHCELGDLLEWRPDRPRFPRLRKKLK